MNTNTILIVILLVIVLGGGAWWYQTYGPGAPAQEGVNVEIGY